MMLKGRRKAARDWKQPISDRRVPWIFMHTFTRPYAASKLVETPVARLLFLVDLHFYPMCKHILNAQVAIRAPCCRQWYDCAECHAEQQGQSHKLAKTMEMVFLCKKCRRAFRKDMSAYEESDEYCPYCDNHYVLPAETPQEPVLAVPIDDVRKDSRMLRDERAPPGQGPAPTEDELAELLND
ncbi:hypothetical protein ACEPAH_8458 [Sanghuangporus vaninii]